VLARPDTQNAQNKALIYELDAAFAQCAQDDAVRVIVLAADGSHFSSGHDLRDRAPMSEFSTIGCAGGFRRPGAEGYMAIEEELYVGMCWRWRDIPKPTIAQVQGKAIAAGLMLAWCCDIIVAARCAQFSDPVVALGVNGHEFFVHTWEVGARAAKEMLFTGEPITAEIAHQLGMVNHVVECENLEAFVLELATRIARMPPMGLRLAKKSVNQSLDAQGQRVAVAAAFSLHQLGHSQNMQIHGKLIDPSGPERIREIVRRPRNA
jgi:enoyl-CoA hydratase